MCGVPSLTEILSMKLENKIHMTLMDVMGYQNSRNGMETVSGNNQRKMSDEDYSVNMQITFCFLVAMLDCFIKMIETL